MLVRQTNLQPARTRLSLSGREVTASRLVRQVLQTALDASGPGAVYRRQLLHVLDRWTEPDTGSPSINVLPALTCRANGGDCHRAAPVEAAWQLIRLAAKLLDDAEDGEQRDQPAVTVNAATGLLFVAQLALGELSGQVPLGRLHRLSEALHHAVLRACAGQHTDLVAGLSGVVAMEPDAWFEMAGAKSGELLAWAAWAGALAGGADEPALTYYREYGYHLGVLLQIADDFNGVWFSGGVSDLVAGRPTLPVCYAMSVTPLEERDCLETLLEHVTQGNHAAEARVQRWLVDLGAQAYLLVAGQVQRRQAIIALRHADPASPADQQLTGLLDSVFPVLGSVDQVANQRSFASNRQVLSNSPRTEKNMGKDGEK